MAVTQDESSIQALLAKTTTARSEVSDSSASLHEPTLNVSTAIVSPSPESLVCPSNSDIISSGADNEGQRHSGTSKEHETAATDHDTDALEDPTVLHGQAKMSESQSADGAVQHIS